MGCIHLVFKESGSYALGYEILIALYWFRTHAVGRTTNTKTAELLKSTPICRFKVTTIGLLSNWNILENSIRKS